MARDRHKIDIIENNTYFVVALIKAMKLLKTKEIEVDAEDIAECIKNRTDLLVDYHRPYNGAQPDGGVSFTYEEHLKLKEPKIKEAEKRKVVTKKD